MELLKVENLSVEIGVGRASVKAVRDVSFSLQDGEILAVCGESGCGKSMLCKSIMGLLPKSGKITEGSIYIEGNDITNYTERQMERLRGGFFSMIFQDPMTALDPTYTIGAQIAESIRINNKDMSKEQIEKRVIELMELVGIENPVERQKLYPYNFSGGMRQRSVMAIALASNPRILFADEPTTALDVTIQAQILELMKELQEETKMSILMITHDMGVVADIADEIIVMYAGKIVEKAPCRELFYHPQHPYTWALLNSVPRIDYEEDSKLIAIEGSIPDMTNPPKGCGFCARCPYAMKICEEYEPPKTQLEKEHEISCWLMHEKADRSGLPYEIGGKTDE